MTFEQAVKTFKKFSKKDLIQMEKDGHIHFPLHSTHIGLLSFLHSFWLSEHWLKRQLSRYSHKKRERLVDTAGMSKFESYIYSRYMNNPEGEKLFLVRVVDEACHYYGVRLTGDVYKKAKLIRAKAQEKRKSRNEGQN